MPMQFKLHSPINKITLLVPQNRMHEYTAKAANAWSEMFLIGAVDLGAVATSHVETLLSEISNICVQQSYRAEDITLELLTAMFGARSSRTQRDAADRIVSQY